MFDCNGEVRLTRLSMILTITVVAMWVTNWLWRGKEKWLDFSRPGRHHIRYGRTRPAMTSDGSWLVRYVRAHVARHVAEGGRLSYLSSSATHYGAHAYV